MTGYAISPLVLAELRSALAYYRSGRDPAGLAFEVEKVIARADEHDDTGERRAWEGFAQAALSALAVPGSGVEVGAATVAQIADAMLSEWRARLARGVPR